MAAFAAFRVRPLLRSAWGPIGAPHGGHVCRLYRYGGPLGGPLPLSSMYARSFIDTTSASLCGFPWKQQQIIAKSSCTLSHLRFGAPSPEVPVHRNCRAYAANTTVEGNPSEIGHVELNQTPEEPYEHAKRFVKDGYRVPVGLWLLGCTAWVFGMVAWGGLTRLTESGLSMTSWRFAGTKWPATEEEWQQEFHAYQQTPEYLQLNYGMTLQEYKRIYFFEWAHRWLGRGVGLLFSLGAVACAAMRCVRKPLAIRLAVYGILGGFQGLVGWWMVRSGFEEPTTEVKTPRVSPYRLAFHLVTAACLYSLLLWQSLSLLLPSPPKVAAAVATAAAAAAKQTHGFAALAGLTFLSGAFVAGNDAGRCCNTWPKMLDNWVPPEVYAQPIHWRRFFENPETVQFDHRSLGYLTFLSSYLLYFKNKDKPFPPSIKAALRFVPIMTSLQLLLGIFTLLYYVPTELGVLHQAGGLLTLSSAIYLMHLLSRFKIKPKF